MNLRDLERRLQRLSRQVAADPEAQRAVEDAEGAPEYVALVGKYGRLVDSAYRKAQAGEPLSPEEGEAVDLLWDAITATAVRLGEARGIPSERVLVALSRG